jgi:hypothetical protein
VLLRAGGRIASEPRVGAGADSRLATLFLNWNLGVNPPELSPAPVLLGDVWDFVPRPFPFPAVSTIAVQSFIIPKRDVVRTTRKEDFLRSSGRASWIVAEVARSSARGKQVRIGTVPGAGGGGGVTFWKTPTTPHPAQVKAQHPPPFGVKIIKKENRKGIRKKGIEK